MTPSVIVHIFEIKSAKYYLCVFVDYKLSVVIQVRSTVTVYRKQKIKRFRRGVAPTPY